jgi:hypothetical protein
MLTIDLELEQSLQAIAQREHSSPNEIIKKLISQYLLQRQSPTAFVKTELKEEVNSPITQSLAGLLAKSNLSELDYKQHLADKYL